MSRGRRTIEDHRVPLMELLRRPHHYYVDHELIDEVQDSVRKGVRHFDNGEVNIVLRYSQDELEDTLTSFSLSSITFNHARTTLEQMLKAIEDGTAADNSTLTESEINDVKRDLNAAIQHLFDIMKVTRLKSGMGSLSEKEEHVSEKYL